MAFASLLLPSSDHRRVPAQIRKYVAEKTGLLFHTANGTPHLNGNLETRWLTPRLQQMGLDEKGMGWHAFKRFRKTWLRGQRCLEDINNFWMAHRPQTVSELYWHLTRRPDYASMKLNESATDSLFRSRKTSLLYRLSRNHSKKMHKKLQRKCRRMLVVH